MKKTVIVALVCVNVALLLALMFGAGTPKAQAQAFRGATDYLMGTGKARGRPADVGYIIDLGRRRLLAWEFNKTRKALVPYRGRELTNDFTGKSRTTGMY